MRDELPDGGVSGFSATRMATVAHKGDTAFNHGVSGFSATRMKIVAHKGDTVFKLLMPRYYGACGEAPVSVCPQCKIPIIADAT